VYLTPGQASALAMRSGKPVQVAGATTADSTLTAEPNGMFAVTESDGPVRAKVRGAWRALNPRLVRNQNGSYSPQVATEPLTLSGGGTGPVATMTDGSYAMALTAPMRLPVPSVEGAVATYRSVLPGVDLVVTALASGGFTDVLVIRSAHAAANPALRTLHFAARTRGLTLKLGKRGSAEAVSRQGAVVFSATAPAAWDSAVARRVPSVVIRGGVRVSRATGLPVASTVAGPGEGARILAAAVTVTAGGTAVRPASRLLTAAAAFPVFADASPQWVVAPTHAASSWAYVSQAFPTTDYYMSNNNTNLKYLEEGDNPGFPGDDAVSFYTMPVPNDSIDGATIHSVDIYFPEIWAYTCPSGTLSNFGVSLYQAHGSLSSATTWNNQPSKGTEYGTDNTAFNYSPSGLGGSSSCPGNDQDIAFDSSTSSNSALTSEIQNIANASNPQGSLVVGLYASDPSNLDSWKLFGDPNYQSGMNATWTIMYAHAPSKPILSTSPQADCTNGNSVLGNGKVSLNAKVSDSDGNSLNGGLTVTYVAYAAGQTADTFATNASMQVPVQFVRGETSAIPSLQLAQADLDNAVTKYGSAGQVKITWTATVSTGLSGIATPSATCSFTFSTAIPGQPVVLDSSGAGCDASSVTYTAGTAASFTFDANGSASIAPTSYTYQLNGGNPVSVTASGSSPYSAVAHIVPTRFTNTLIVNAVAAGGNIGQSSYCTFDAAAAAAAADQDLTGDGIPDLLTVGSGSTGTASGLWLANGQASKSRFDGTVDTTASDIAPNGPQDVATPSSWNGLKALAGQFTDNGFNDIEAYQPGTGNAYVLPGQGDGSATTSDEQNLTDVFEDSSQVSGNTNFPNQLVNAYTVSADGGTAEPYPDQIGVFTDPSGSVGSYLGYFANSDGVNSFDAANYLGLPFELTNTTPDGTMDWNNWTISTDSDTRAGVAYTDLWLWNNQTGSLYLWELSGLDNEAAGGFNFSTFTNVNPTATLAYSQTQISASWNTGASLSTIQAADIDGDPGLITVSGTGQVRSWADSSGAFTQVNAAGPTQVLLTATHNYPLNDGTTGAVSTADDQAGAGVTAQNLTGNSGTGWNNGDLFSPDVLFNGTSGYLSTGSSSGLFTPNGSFTISAWVDPSKLGGAVLSQDGSTYSTVVVSSTTGGAWSVAMDTGSGNSYVAATSGTARVGMWTNLVVTFDAAGGADVLKLYADGVEVAYQDDPTLVSATGKFLVGADQVNGAVSSFFTGQLADVQVWDNLAAPAQPGTQPSVFVPVTPVRIMDTRSATKIGPVTGPIAADGTATLPIDGITTNGVDLPATGVSAVAVAITVASQTEGGFLTAYPAGTPRPEVSTVNFTTAKSFTNNAIVPVGPSGAISIYSNSTGTVQLLVDITGYFTTNTGATNASTYTPLADPTRIMDTRSATKVGPITGPVGSDVTVTLPIEGITTNGADVPASGVTAVALNLTVVPTGTGDNGYLVTYPDGITRPNVSTLWYDAVSNLSQSGTVIIPVGSDGKIDIYNASGNQVNLVGDLSGYFTTSTTGQYYHSLDSTRIIDTRDTSALAADAGLTITNPASILADNPTLVLNITATQEATGGFLQAYPGTAARPASSIVNFISDQDAANLALVGTAASSSFAIFNNSGGNVQVVVDTNGYFD
jgi:hypothetical protein